MQLEVDTISCSGCRLCETVCTLRRTRACGYSGALMKVVRKELTSAFFIKHCGTCETRACLSACNVGAINLDAKHGSVHVTRDQCRICGACVDACPDGLIVLEDEGPVSCDMCGGDPECARFCPNGALQWRR